MGMEFRDLAALPVSRRRTLLGMGASAASLAAPSFAFAGSPIQQRLVLLNIMGGLDGLAALIPYGDSNLTTLRQALLPPPVGQTGGMLDLDGYFALSPAMPNLHAMYQAGEALMIHQVGPPVFIRSHFAGQNYLQYGATSLLTDGWGGRMLGYLPHTGNSLQTGVAMGPTTPIIMQGTLTDGWGGDNFTHTAAGLGSTCLLDVQPDATLYQNLTIGINDRGTFSSILSANPPPSGSPLVTLAGQAGAFMSSGGNTGVASLQTTSVDTHASQNVNLTPILTDIDNALQNLKVTLGSAWSNTVILTMTEFGRMAAINGSAGTDHGTGFAMFLVGGAVKGGSVLNSGGGSQSWQKWTDLTSSGLYQGRDVPGNTDFRAVASGVLRDHMGMNSSQLATIFPDYSGPIVSGMIKAGQ